MSRKARIVIFIVVVYALVFGIGYTLGTHSTRQTPRVSDVGTLPVAGSVRVLYSLDKKQNDKELISLINNAHKYIYFAIYEFTLRDVADALVHAKERGVDVRGIVDRENSTTSYEAPIITILRSAGIPIETQTHPTGIMHIKALVTENAYASGSYNWTWSATNINDEVLEIGTDPALHAAYETILQKVFAANAGGKIAGLPAGAGQSPAPAGRKTPTQDVISYLNAKTHIGEKARVSGTITRVYIAKSGTAFFDYCVNYSSCPFSSIIFKSDRTNFGNLMQYQGATITVSGLITSYQGRAEIVLHDPSQITK